MIGFGLSDQFAFAFFAAAWFGYHMLVEHAVLGRRGLSGAMDVQRRGWMLEMVRRENRIVDTSINAGLQSGTAFFASTSLLALGATATLLRTTDDVLKLFSDFPYTDLPTRTQWEVKVLGLTAIFGYAFFKFAWSYRLFNYAGILIGATPPAREAAEPMAKLAALRAAKMNTAAGRAFSRGQRAFFFSIGYMGWFVSPWLFLVTTSAVVLVIARRQFASDALEAADLGLEALHGPGKAVSMRPDAK